MLLLHDEQAIVAADISIVKDIFSESTTEVVNIDLSSLT